MSQIWIFVVAFLFTSQVISCAPHPDALEVGTCRFEKTSVAVLSCTQPDKIWRPPSRSCCKALLYAIDYLPVSGESGACCLCRYLRTKGSQVPERLVVRQYVLCQGKDSHFVKKTWNSFPLTSCAPKRGGCPSSDGSSAAQKDGSSAAQKDGSSAAQKDGGSTIFNSVWTIAGVATSLVFLVCVWWWVMPSASTSKPSQSGHGEDGPGGSGRRASARQRKMSSRSSAHN